MGNAHISVQFICDALGLRTTEYNVSHIGSGFHGLLDMHVLNGNLAVDLQLHRQLLRFNSTS